MQKSFIFYWIMLGFSFLFLLPQTEAQILNRLKRKIERKAEEKAEQVIDEEFDKALSKRVDEEFQNDSTYRDGGELGGYDRTNAALADAMAGGFMDKFDVSHVELPDDYDFEMTIDYQIETEGEEPVNMSFIIPPKKEKYMGFTGTDQSQEFEYMVWDLDRKIFVMYQQKNGDKTLMKLPNFATVANQDMEKEMEEYSDMEIRKTKETKRILGYKCTKYIMENEEFYLEAWIAPKFPYTYEQFSGLVSTQMRTPGYSTISNEEGYALEMLSREKKKNAKATVMKVVNLDESKFSIDNSEYQSAH